MPKVFLKIRDPESGMKVALPIEKPLAYPFLKFVNLVRNVLENLDFEEKTIAKSKSKLKK